MKRLLRLAARLYPAAWRNRYGVEFQALLDDNTPRWRDLADILIGGLEMRLAHAHTGIAVAAFSAAGAIAAAAIAFATFDRFVSAGTMHIRPAAQPAASAVVRLEDRVPGLARDAFNDAFLGYVIETRGLYRRERDRAQTSMTTLVTRMRGDIGLDLLSPTLVRVSFTSTDAQQTQRVVTDLMSRLVEANLTRSVSEPSATVVQVIDPSGEGRIDVPPQRVAAAGIGGLGGGALVGMLFGLRRRRPSQPAA